MPRNNYHSREVQDILGKPPSWLIRWGITVLFLIIASLVGGCYFIKYPEVITVPATVVPVQTASDNNDSVAVKIQIPSNLHDKVKKGQSAIIKLHDYSFMQYGVLNGIIYDVDSISEEIQTDNGIVYLYSGTVNLNNNTTTSTGVSIPVRVRMSASAEITVRYVRLLDYILAKP